MDTATIIAHMQKAVDVVLSGEHNASKVAACAFHPAHPEFEAVAAVSPRPDALKPHFPWDARIGASSQFIHAELAALLKFKGPMRGAHICITDPFCPNCAKNLAEAGIRALYIDHKGFQKDFIARNGDEFKTMSMLIAEKAGISVYEVNRKAGTVTPILEQHTLTRPSASAIEFFDIDAFGQEGSLTLESAMKMFRDRLGARETWALAFVKEKDGSPRGLLAFEALPPGITPEDFKTRDIDTGKYRFPVDPLTRILITMRRMGMTLLDKRIGCARVPSSRALVNALGMDISDLLLASRNPDHDASGPDALKILIDKKILNVTEI
jgi:deoxycytidylate deaminase